jgi:hypothetical protein
MSRCRACNAGIEYGAGQCVKADGRNLRVVDHNKGTGIVIQAADLGDFKTAMLIADEERIK